MNAKLTTGAARLATWFAKQCDGEREHTCGVHIETTDNPGWMVKVDIEGTSVQWMTGNGNCGGFSWSVHRGQLWGYDEGTGDLEGLLTVMVDLLEMKPA